MQISWLLMATCATLARVQQTMAEDPPYYCTSDAYCAKKYPGTVCIAVEMESSTIKKCTPNSGTRKACRGANFGLCPSYQPPERELLDAHCVFIAEDPVTSGSASGATSTTEKPPKKKTEASSGSTSAGAGSTKTETEAPKKTNATRLLKAQATTTEAPKKTTAAPKSSTKESSASSKATSTTSSKASSKATSTTSSKASSKATSTASSGTGSSSKAAASGAGGEELPGGYIKLKVGNSTVTGRFACLTVSDCQQKAADPSTCVPSACGSSDQNLCSHQGTCTYTSKAKLDRRACACYLGFRGDKCQFDESDKCDVDCGAGGDCVAGKCKCRKGFDGKSYLGKKGKPDRRCTKCTNDQACQNDGKCNTDEGKCECPAGFSGASCGAKEDGCVTVKCGNNGACHLDKKGNGVCFCSVGDPDFQQCADKSCSTCPESTATSRFSGRLLVALLGVVAISWLT